jgi:long-chain fatty acid transport protein
MQRGILCLAASVLLLAVSTPASAQGIIASSAGPINASMGGASTAAPIEFGGSYWNPAIISGLSSQEFLLGSGIILPDIQMQSTIPAGSIMGQFPRMTRTNTATSSSGVPTNIATGFSFRMEEDSPLTMGLGVFGLVGGGVNYEGNAASVLSVHNAPTSFGVGPIYANMALLTINPMMSYQFTDKLAVGGGPVITSGTANFNPAFFTSSPGKLGLPVFPSATNSHPFWGGGFQFGLLYEVDDDWNIGFSYKSQVWQQRWDYNATYANGTPRQIGIQATLPEIFSWGVAYKGIENALIALDLRYMDYAGTQLFGQKVINGGLGWNSVFAVALGAQYEVTEKLTLRAGYLFNTNPIPAVGTLFNVQAPAITEHTLSLGASYAIKENMLFSLAWIHGFDNSIQGPILQIPGASIKYTTQTDTIFAGVNVSFGGRKVKRPTESDTETAAASPAEETTDN